MSQRLLCAVLSAGLLGGWGVYASAAGQSSTPSDLASPYSPLDKQRFSQPMTALGREQKLDFQLGKALFERLWVSSPASTKSADGLGPLFNARACLSCHIGNGRGQPPLASSLNDPGLSMVVRLGRPALSEDEQQLLEQHAANLIPDPRYGEQLQTRAVTGIKAEGHFRLRYQDHLVVYPDGQRRTLRRPMLTLSELAYGPLHPSTRQSARVAPALIGLGLLEQIPAERLMALSDESDHDQDGISGRINWVKDPLTGEPRIGRFNWKASAVDIPHQNALALSLDLGLSSALRPAASGDCTAVQQACLSAPAGDDPKAKTHELSPVMTALLDHYTRHLAVPAPRATAAARRGRQLFKQTGCADCHTPSHTTAENPRYPALSNQQIWPYTDLLLHDMGKDLADGVQEGSATGQEWRTPPLWGIGLIPAVNGHQLLLHDGRARGVEEAILWHGGEAQSARERFMALEASERQALIRFIESL